MIIGEELKLGKLAFILGGSIIILLYIVLVGGTLLKFLIPVWLAIIILFLVFSSNKTLKSRKRERDLHEFRGKLEQALRRKVEQAPGFRTFCNNCIHFDTVKRGCTLDSITGNPEIRLKAGDKFTYCLYWNVNAYPVLKKKRKKK